jgi:hypothetical protein
MNSGRNMNSRSGHSWSAPNGITPSPSSLRFTLNLNGPTFGLRERAGKGTGLPQASRLGRIAAQEIGDFTGVQPMQNNMPLLENRTDVRSVGRRPPTQVRPCQSEEAGIPTQPQGNAPILRGTDPVHSYVRITPSHKGAIGHLHLADKVRSAAVWPAGRPERAAGRLSFALDDRAGEDIAANAG